MLEEERGRIRLKFHRASRFPLNNNNNNNNNKNNRTLLIPPGAIKCSLHIDMEKVEKKNVQKYISI